LNGFHHFLDRFGLANNHTAHLFSHSAKFFAFCLHHPFHRDAGHHAYYFGYCFFINRVALVLAFFFPMIFRLFEVFLQTFFCIAK
jgi:hypothetical protein